MISRLPNAVDVTMADNGNQAIPLRFTFPFFGQNFTQSWMHDNGVVSFQQPSLTGNFCCTGSNLATATNPALNYAIMPLWTDLIATTGRHWYLSRPNDVTYAWYNVNQYGTNNTNSFEVKIDRWGLVDVRLQGVLITNSLVTSGMTGNLAQGQYYQFHHGSGFSTQIQQWSALGGTTAAVDSCTIDPLSSPECPGYSSAYLTQQCTISALYDPSCPNYAQANFTYQCSINPLHSELCPGYAQAYYKQQCSINPLYDSGCTGYAQAYYKQQCSINPLYDSGCTGYAQANFAYQCSINPLYGELCPGYAQAYYKQQCSLNGLYDRNCPNYATAYATQQLLASQQTTTSTDTATVTDVVSDPATQTTSTASASGVSPADVTTAVSLTQAPAVTGAVNLQSLSAQAVTPAPAPAAQPKTRAQQLHQARQAAQRQAAVARGTQAQKDSQNASSLEEQVAAQITVITVMGHNAAFAAYENVTLRDVQFYRPREIYGNQVTVDNQRVLRGLSGASDRRHKELVDQQYR
jgi:hypothetical protein